MFRTLRSGDTGVEVRALQDVLNFHIRRFEPLVVDGKFGPKTQARVIAFQRSNHLGDDGVAGFNTNNKLFESQRQVVPLSILSASTSAFGIRPPTLIPPLTLPGLPGRSKPPLIPVPQLTLVQLLPSSSVAVPPLGKGQTLALNLTVPFRNDPVDPAVASFRQIVQLLNGLPPNFPFRAALIGAIPDPIKVIGDVSSGFKWGIDPVFDLKKVAGPTEFAVGAKVDASYTVTVVNGTGPSGIKLALFAKGDFKGTVDYTSQLATSTPLFQMQGAFTLGIDGRF